MVVLVREVVVVERVVVLVRVVVALVLMAFVIVGMRGLSRLRLGIVLEGIGRTQRFAFRARRGKPNNCPAGLPLEAIPAPCG